MTETKWGPIDLLSHDNNHKERWSADLESHYLNYVQAMTTSVHGKG